MCHFLGITPSTFTSYANLTTGYICFDVPNTPQALRTFIASSSLRCCFGFPCGHCIACTTPYSLQMAGLTETSQAILIIPNTIFPPVACPPLRYILHLFHNIFLHSPFASTSVIFLSYYFFQPCQTCLKPGFHLFRFCFISVSGGRNQGVV